MKNNNVKDKKPLAAKLFCITPPTAGQREGILSYLEGKYGSRPEL